VKRPHHRGGNARKCPGSETRLTIRRPGRPLSKAEKQRAQHDIEDQAAAKETWAVDSVLTIWQPPRPLSEAEKQHLDDDIKARLESLKAAYEAATNEAEKCHHLEALMTLCWSFRPLPDWAVMPVRELLLKQVPPPTPREIVLLRSWQAVEVERENGRSYESAYKEAGKKLKVPPSTIKKHYWDYEKKVRTGSKNSA
jgi:hypothetical protein